MQKAFSVFDVRVILIGYFDVQSIVRLSRVSRFFRDTLSEHASNGRLWSRSARALGAHLHHHQHQTDFNSSSSSRSMKRHVLLRKLAARNWRLGALQQLNAHDFSDEISSACLVGDAELLVVKMCSVMESKGIVDCELAFCKHELVQGVLEPAHYEHTRFMDVSWRYRANQVQTFIHAGSACVLIYGRQFDMCLYDYLHPVEAQRRPSLSHYDPFRFVRQIPELFAVTCRQYDEQLVILELADGATVLFNPVSGHVSEHRETRKGTAVLDTSSGQVSMDGVPLFSVKLFHHVGYNICKPQLLQRGPLIVVLHSLKSPNEPLHHRASIYHCSSGVLHPIDLMVESVNAPHLSWRNLIVFDSLGRTLILDATSMIQSEKQEINSLSCVVLDVQGKLSDVIVDLSDSSLSQLNQGYYLNENSARELVVASTNTIRVIVRGYSWGGLALQLPNAKTPVTALPRNPIASLIAKCYSDLEVFGSCIFFARRVGNNSFAYESCTTELMTTLGLTPMSSGRVPCSPLFALSWRCGEDTVRKMLDVFSSAVVDMKGNNVAHVLAHWSIAYCLKESPSTCALYGHPNDSHLLPIHCTGVTEPFPVERSALYEFCDGVYFPPLEEPLNDVAKDHLATSHWSYGDWSAFLRKGLHERGSLEVQWIRIPVHGAGWDPSSTWDLYRRFVLPGDYLDLGAGSCGAAMRLLEHRLISSAVCVDCFLGALAAARKKLGPKGKCPVQLVLADIGAWPDCPYKPETFSTVCAFYSVQHVWGTRERARFCLSLISRLLKSGGRFIALLPLCVLDRLNDGRTSVWAAGEWEVSMATRCLEWGEIELAESLLHAAEMQGARTVSRPSDAKPQPQDYRFGVRDGSGYGHSEFEVRIGHLVSECTEVNLQLKLMTPHTEDYVFAVFEKN